MKRNTRRHIHQIMWGVGVTFNVRRHLNRRRPYTRMLVGLETLLRVVPDRWSEQRWEKMGDSLLSRGLWALIVEG